MNRKSKNKSSEINAPERVSSIKENLFSRFNPRNNNRYKYLRVYTHGIEARYIIRNRFSFSFCYSERGRVESVIVMELPFTYTIFIFHEEYKTEDISSVSFKIQLFKYLTFSFQFILKQYVLLLLFIFFCFFSLSYDV